mmetsp:Transcript_2929/g.10277  ORF Transcript_2929/g.10277 Transcript_2929/m.10277 type:complete len:313 (-) Transcript_2929:42-980(-)|eukprot:CAMPEP_0114616122 /NCGR_PEP_ID=MMETSP0168-20121206/6524_1 /TAXON_ID=95228 ORGANISM="Vannella sp., Strain DIVA3 517/6/12" /NCGR_SAMPLE_ID=MMETSP0168 /ASSEMBLY_ACC=CAM_ASM_000044 /LENGTH=312 /DNA_ID=CAMNT_0001827227 /DNA_START=47 /DNA_END=985 /DNA_ORIENTATION=-
MFCCFDCILAPIGAVVFVYWAIQLTMFVLRHFTAPKVDLSRLGAKKGAWAVVTGASDGIGKAYAVELAKNGFNVFLISRTLSKLEEVAKTVESFGVKSKVMSVDFIKADEAVYAEIERECNALQVGVLVNNVGINYEFPHRLLEETAAKDDDIIRVNVGTTTKMTRIVLAQMVERKAGAILNLSSMAGRASNPMLAVYSGTKAYIDFYSKAIAEEYKKHGIMVMSVTPGLVISNMSKISKPSLMVCKAEHIAKYSLARLGKVYELSPYWFHAIINRVLGNLPLSVTLGQLLKMNESIQKRALRKKERQAKSA